MLLYTQQPKIKDTDAIAITNPARSQTEPTVYVADSPFPVPPPELMEYGESVQVHLAQGKETIDTMRSIVERNGQSLKAAKRILEFGCANGRLIRWLANDAEEQEIWGVDIQSDKIVWAIENLSPLFNFAVNTTVPSLPFADGYFDFIYAGSIFSHINELHVSWLLELARVLAPKGMAYLTFHDESTLEYIQSNPANRISQLFKAHPLSTSIFANEYDFVSICPYGEAKLSQVVMHSRYIKQMTQSVLKCVDIVPNAYSKLQTAYVFRGLS